MACTAKHTKFQPADGEWKCPKCGGGADVFYIEEPVENTDDCPLLHSEDTVYCNNCEKAWSGTTLAKMFEKRAAEGDYETCPCCKGVGRVKKTK